MLVVRDWADVTPALLRGFLANYTVRKPLYQYEVSAPRGRLQPVARTACTSHIARLCCLHGA